MNKQIISLMCVAVVLALALVVANEIWPDGYRTPPQGGSNTALVGTVATGPVTLPEDIEAKSAVEQESVQDKTTADDATTSASVADEQKNDAPQGELVAIDSGTLKSDVPTKSDANTKKPEPKQTTAPEASKPEVKPAVKPTPKPESKPAASLGVAVPKILLYTHEAVLEIKANGPVRCKTFKLISPDRLVVDLIGKWKVPTPTVPSNTIIQRVRVGEAPERTRIVLDLKRPLKVDKIVQVNDTTINVRMQ